MKYPLSDDLLLISGKDKSFLLIAKSPEAFVIFIERPDEELTLTIEQGDMVAVSAPEGGDIMQAKILIALIMKYRMPLMVLPKDHPGSRHFRMLVSAGDEINTRCDIQRGTHPEQDLICSSDFFSGLKIRKIEGGVELRGLPADATVQRISCEISCEAIK